jgi:5-formaminoimidazole-4-carboxamide-1-beta-D-ribofuranosyl 5'-monophosphate synthetase
MIACGSREVSLECRDIPTFIGTGLESLIDGRSTRLEDEWLIKIHIQIFAVGFDIAVSGFYKPIHAEIILLGIDAC